MAADAFDPEQLLRQGCRVLDDAGIFDEHGHLSVRTGPKTAMINALTSPLTASLRDFVEVDIDGGYPDAAPSETPIHTATFRARDDVDAICHHHSPYAVAVSSVDGLAHRAVHGNGAIQSGDIPRYEAYHEEGGSLVTTEAEGDDLAATLGGNQAVMLRGHGAVVVGSSIAEAVVFSLKLEYNARLLYRQSLLGQPWYLPDELAEIDSARVRSEGGVGKSLDYYLAKYG